MKNYLRGYRKFIAFLTGTVLLYVDKISSEEWLWLAGIYMGLNAVVKGINVVKEKVNGKCQK